MDNETFIPIAVGICVIMVALVCVFPQRLPTTTLAMACLFEMALLRFEYPRTDQIPVFWDVNTIVQHYAHVEFKAIPASPFEIMILVAAPRFFTRGAGSSDAKFRLGGMFYPMAAFLGFVLIGFLYGIATGGQLNIALMEVRPLVYMLIAYLMVVNARVPARIMAERMMWVTAYCVSFKALQAVVRYFGELHGITPPPELGIGSHEESFFFNVYVLMLLVLWMVRENPKLRTYLIILLPFVVWMNLVNQRRAATAAMALGIVITWVMSYWAMPERRKMIAFVCVFAVVGGEAYYKAFENKSGLLAQPARALKSQNEPDPRDAASNAYRDAENYDLYATMRTSPIIGYGYGKPFIEFVPIVVLTNIDPLILVIPHDSQLWVWMRTGTLGYISFWIMCSTFLIAAGQTCRDPRFGRRAKAVALFVAGTLLMQMIFGLLDMQLSSIRNMLFLGLWVGMLTNERLEVDEGLVADAVLAPRSKPVRVRGPWPTIESRQAQAQRGRQ